MNLPIPEPAELLRLTPDGKVFVHGRLIANNGLRTRGAVYAVDKLRAYLDGRVTWVEVSEAFKTVDW